jgi:hypothetical protein
MAKPSKMVRHSKKSSSNSTSTTSTSKKSGRGFILIVMTGLLMYALMVLVGSSRQLPIMIDTSIYNSATGSNQIHIAAVSVDKTYIDPEIQEDAEADKEHLWCPVPLMRAGAETLSTSNVWHNLYEQILNASYHAHPRIETLNTTQLRAYKDWVDQLYSFYTPSKLRRSIMNPAPPKEIVLPKSNTTMQKCLMKIISVYFVFYFSADLSQLELAVLGQQILTYPNQGTGLSLVKNAHGLFVLRNFLTMFCSMEKKL